MVEEARRREDNVAYMLSRAADQRPDHPAVVTGETAVSYRELAARAGAVADALAAAGVSEGDRVVVLLERGPDAVASYFGVLALGAIAIVANEMLRPRQVEYYLSHSGATALIISEAIRARTHRDIDLAQARQIRMEDVGARGELRPVGRASSDPAQITYTSGSTGLPKGVVACHSNVWAAIETVAGYQGILPSDRIAGLLPISGVYGANQMLCAVLTGATLVVPHAALMNDVAQEVRDQLVTVLAAVPPLWLQLLAAPQFTAEPIPSLRVLQNAGGHLAPSAVRQLRAAQPQARLFLQYGMTEVFRSTFLSPEEIDARPDCMGRPIPGAEILVLREDGTPCEPGEVGELVHAGPTVTLGYWNDPARTSEVYRAHPARAGMTVVHSGDMVRADPDGFLYFVGRRDRMIKTLGYRVGPDEILDVLYASGLIREGIVTAEEDAARGHRIVAYVALKDGAEVKDLERFARMELPRYMQPAKIRALDSLPKLPNGKHDLLALQQAFAAPSPA